MSIKNHYLFQVWLGGDQETNNGLIWEHDRNGLTEKFGSEFGGRDETGAFLLFVSTANGPLVVVAVDEQAKFSDGSIAVFVDGGEGCSRRGKSSDYDIPMGGVVVGILVGLDIVFHFELLWFGYRTNIINLELGVKIESERF